MPRKPTKHAPIVDERERSATFLRRRDSLIKKASELSELCGIKIGVIIDNHNDGYSMLWPSDEAFTSLADKFFSIPDKELEKKMVPQEKFLIEEIEDKEVKSLKLKQKIVDKESELFMYQIGDEPSFRTLTLEQLGGMYNFAGEKLKELKKRNDELEEKEIIIIDENGENVIPGPPRSPTTGLMPQEDNTIAESSNHGEASTSVSGVGNQEDLSE